MHGHKFSLLEHRRAYKTYTRQGVTERSYRLEDFRLLEVLRNLRASLL